MAAPDEAAIDRLVNQSVATAKGTDAFMGPERKPDPSNGVPHAAWFARINGGRRPSEYIGQSVSTFKYTYVDLIYRGNAKAFSPGQTVARNGWTALQGLDAAQVTGYVNTQIQQSEPIFLGFDETEHPRWTFTVEFWSGGT